MSAPVRLHIAVCNVQKKLICRATGKINRCDRVQARAMMSTQRARTASFSFLRYANISMCLYLQHQKAINPPSLNLTQYAAQLEWRQCQWRFVFWQIDKVSIFPWLIYFSYVDATLKSFEKSQIDRFLKIFSKGT